MLKTIIAAVVIAIVGFLLVGSVGFGIAENGALAAALGLLIGVLVGARMFSMQGEIKSTKPGKQQHRTTAVNTGGGDSVSIFVGNLAYKTRGKQLAQLFEPYGEILSIRIVKDRATGRAKGFGFVEMHSNEARNAISELDGKEFFGRQLKVSEANTQKPEL